MVQRLALELQAWKQKAQAVRLKPDTEAESTMSAEDLERLRSLGYIQ